MWKNWEESYHVERGRGFSLRRLFHGSSAPILVLFLVVSSLFVILPSIPSISHIVPQVQATNGIAPDGTATNHSTSTTSLKVSLTTTNTNNVIVLFVGYNAVNSPISKVNDTAGLTWNLRAQKGNAGNSIGQSEYYALAPNTLSGDTITIFCTSSNIGAEAVGVPNAILGLPFNSTNPAVASAGTKYSGLTANTIGTNELLLGGLSMVGTGTLSVPSSWTLITSGSGPDSAAEYQVVSASGSYTYNITSSVANAWAFIADALIQTYSSPTLIQSSSGASATNPTCVYSSAVTSGDVLAIGVVSQSSTPSYSDTLTDNFSKINTVAVSGSLYEGLAYTTAKSTGSNTITVNVGGTAGAVVCVELNAVTATSATYSTGTSASGTAISVVSYAPALNSFVFAVEGDASSTITGSSSAPYTLITNQGQGGISANTADEYNKTWLGGSTTSPFTLSSTTSAGEISIDFPSSIVTQPISVSLAESGATQGTFALSGCGVSPTTILSDGSQHNFNAQPSCSITVTVPSDTSTTRYRFSGSSTTATVTTCSSGTCSNSAKTAYYQDNLTAKYSISDSSSPTAPKVAYTSVGTSNTKTTLTTSYQTIWIDYKSSLGWTNPLSGSTSSQKWITTSANISSLTTAQTENLTYYHQYAVFLQTSGLTATGTSLGVASTALSNGSFVDSASNLQITGLATFTYPSISSASYAYQESTQGFQVVSNVTISNLAYSSGGQLGWTASASAKTQTGIILGFTVNSASSTYTIAGSISTMSGSGSMYYVFTTSGGGGGGGGGSGGGSGPAVTTVSTINGTATTIISTRTPPGAVVSQPIPSTLFNSSIGLMIIVLLIVGLFGYYARTHHSRKSTPNLNLGSSTFGKISLTSGKKKKGKGRLKL